MNFSCTLAGCLDGILRRCGVAGASRSDFRGVRQTRKRRRSLSVSPEDLESTLARSPEYRRAFDGLSPEQKQDLVQWIKTARDLDHRKQRLDTTVRSLR